VINETIKPEEAPRIMKAIPVRAVPKMTPSPIPVRRAIPLEPFKKN